MTTLTIAVLSLAICNQTTCISNEEILTIKEDNMITYVVNPQLL